MKRFALAAATTLALALAAPASALPPTASPTAVAHSHGPDPASIYTPRDLEPVYPNQVDAPAPWAASQYDGLAPATDQPDVTTLPQVHAIYMHPSDKPSRFSTFAAMFQADARQGSQLLAGLYGRGVRFDERAGAGGVPFLDITVFRSKNKANRLGGSNQFSMVEQELRASGKFSSATKKYLVWLDAPSRYCGQAELYQDTRRQAGNNSELRTTAIVYRPYSSTNADGGFCRGRTMLHEIGHNLGAVQRVAPNAFDGAHCDDDQEDVMCYEDQTTFDSGTQGQFDWRNDDYWDPGATTAGNPQDAAGKLGWWAVNLNKFVCPLGGCGAANNAPGY